MNNNKKSFLYIINVFFISIMIIPFYWTISNSLKQREDVITYPPQIFPNPLTLEHYQRIFTAPMKTGEINYLPMIGNSLYLGIAVTLGVCLVASLAGFAISLRPFPGRKVAFYLILSSMLIPFQALLIPLFTEMNLIGLVDNRFSLLFIYMTFFMPLGMFIMKNTFASIPGALYESARIEGCSEWGVFFRIALPNAKMGLGTVAVFTSASVWNEFLMSLIFMTSQENYTLPVGLAFSYQPPFDIDWGRICAVSVITFLPTILLFICLKKYFISGVTSGALSAE